VGCDGDGLVIAMETDVLRSALMFSAIVATFSVKNSVKEAANFGPPSELI